MTQEHTPDQVGKQDASLSHASFWVWLILLGGAGVTAASAYLPYPWTFFAVIPFVLTIFLLYAFGRKYQDFRQALWNDFGKRVLYTVVLAIVVFIPSRLGSGAEATIVFIGPASDPHWVSFVRGFDAAIKKCLPHGRCEIDETGEIAGHLSFNETRYDFVYLPNETKGDTERYMRALSPDTVMIIGFVRSTEADNALRTLDSKEMEHHNWPTLILPMATASRLLQRYNGGGDRPILRIVPSNAAQAEEMAARLDTRAQPGERTVAIFRDSSNEVYSADLARELRPRAEAEGVAVVFDGSIGSSGPGAYVTDSVAILEPDVVVFFGMLETAIPLARQLKIMQGTLCLQTNERLRSSDNPNWQPKVFFSDGSVNSAVASFAALNELEGVEGFFPHGSPNGHWKEHAPNATTSSPAPGPSFEYFGHDTAVIVSAILKSVQTPTRAAVRTATLDFRKDHASIPQFQPTSFDDQVVLGPYRFTSNGEVVGMPYHVWKLAPDGWYHFTDESEQNAAAASRTPPENP